MLFRAYCSRLAVSSGVLRSSTHTANYELLIMMPSDNYYMNQDGVVHHDYFCVS